MQMPYSCPACGFSRLKEKPYFSYEICPKCDIEFGYDDYPVRDASAKEKSEFYRNWARKKFPNKFK